MKYIWSCNTYEHLKAFDTIDHDFLMAKLGMYGFETASLTLIKSHLINSLQRTKVYTSLSSWSKLLLGTSSIRDTGTSFILFLY